MRRYGIFFVAAPVAVVCVSLGLWQLGRLKTRRALNERLRASRVTRTISGRWDYGHQVLVEGRVIEGAPAVIIVTPLLLADSSAMLVERGWTGTPDARSVRLDSLVEGDSVTLSGVPADPGPDLPVPPDSTWPRRLQRANPASLSPLFPYRLQPELIRRTDTPAPLRAVPPPEITDGPHLGYAIQWFSFAIIVLVGSMFLARAGEKGKGRGEK